MASVIFEEQVAIPLDVRTLADFRRWAQSDDFPERGRIDFIAGNIEVDMSPEDLFVHGTLKTEIVATLLQRVKELDLGCLFVDKTRASNEAANLSVEPDVVLVTHADIDEGRVRFVPKATGEEDRFVEVEGSPALVVEIVSDSSVQKDTRRLPVAYYAAGVAEFWLIDARSAELLFMIQRRGASGFEPAASDEAGFQRSDVLGVSYRLDRSRHRRGFWVYDLAARPE